MTSPWSATAFVIAVTLLPGPGEAAQTAPRPTAQEAPRPAPPVVMGTEVTPERPATRQAPAPAPAARPAQTLSAPNIRLDLVITDTHGGTPVKKTVSMLVRNGGSGSIRTSSPAPRDPNVFGPPPTTAVELNLDAHASEVRNGLINVTITFEYTPAGGQPAPTSPESLAPRLRESLDVVLRTGRALLVSQSADPATERTVTVELTATFRE